MAYVNLKDARKLIKIAHNSNLIPVLVGSTGIGKSQGVYQLAIEENVDYVPIFLSEKEPTDFTGLQKINEFDRSANCPPNWLPWRVPTAEMIASGDIPRDQGYIFPQGGYIFLDEFNTAKDEMRQACKELLTEGRVGTYFLPPNYKLILAMNPSNAGNYTTYDLDEALINRGSWIKVRPDFQEVMSYLSKKHGASPVTLWLQNCNGESFLNPSLEFDIPGMIYSSRITEAHILFWNQIRSETPLFQRAALETIFKEELVESFLSFCEEIYRVINYKDILLGNKTKEAQQVIKENRWDVLGIVVNDLANFFKDYQFKKSEVDLFPKEKEEEVLNNLCDFLTSLSDEFCVTFIESLNSPIENLRCVTKQEVFKQKVIKEKLALNNTARKTAKEMGIIK